jgi:hypothetical protein
MDMASRAAATDHRTLDCDDSAVLQQLRQLHPAASTTPMPVLPNDAHSPIIFNDAALVRLIRRCNNGKAGGPSGWNGAMLAVLTNSPTCMEGICSVISDITSGRIPAAVRPHITATRLVALAKPNGAPRPIAMGELFYRVAAVRAVRAASDSARGLLAPHQYGVGVPGGCEHIIHCMQHSLTHIADDRPLAAVKVDISNAFNTCQRPRLLSLLLKTPQLSSLHRLAYWAYSQPTTLIPQCKGAVSEERFIQSANGVRQGDPLSTLLFCLYLKPAIDALARNPVFGNRIRIYVYVDDVYIVGTLDDVLTAHIQLIQHLRDIELVVNPDKCSLLYFHQSTHPLTTVQSLAVTGAGLQWTAGRADSAEVLGATIGVNAAAIAERLNGRLGGAAGLFGAFIRRVQSGGFSVQAAMLLLAHSVSRLAYLQRCLPPAALQHVAGDWDVMLLSAAATVLDLANDEASGITHACLQRPRRLGGFGLSSAVFVSPLAFIASIAGSAAQPGTHPLSDDALPSESLLHQWLQAALTCPTVTDIQDHGCDGMHYNADTFTSHFHSLPSRAVSLQHRLTTVATNSLFNARVSQVQQAAGADRELARLYGGKAKYASRWKTVTPTETAYRLSDEFYRYSARRDLGLPPTRDRVLPHRCNACGMGVAEDGGHGQRCIHNSTFTKLRHDSIEVLLHNVIRDGIGIAWRQQHDLPAADRTIPDLLIYLDNKAFLCDVTVADTLADSNLRYSKLGPGRLAEKKADKKERKYRRIATEMQAEHLPFAIETMGGLSGSAERLLREVHHSASTHCTWRDADAIGSHLLDCVAIAVQRCTGMALRASVDRETTRVLGARAA